jgi:predicted nuclease of restriction endonuclease-like (RecB) superfamily
VTNLDHYAELLGQVKARITGAQARAALAANRELLALYWEIGRLIDTRQTEEGWGAGVIPRLARDLATELPDARGFSERNLKRMVQYQHAYPQLGHLLEPGAAGLRATETDGSTPQIGPRAVAQSPTFAAEAIGPQAVAKLAARSPHDACAYLSLGLPWGHNILLLQKVTDHVTRLWYMQQCASEGWSRDVLALMLKSQAHARQGAATTNFDTSLPSPQSDLAHQTLKDPYVFDFLTLDAGFRERELELGLLAHLERFLLELGIGFAFVGRQHHIALGDDDFYLDLLFYHLKLRCFVVIDLKVGPFKAEFAGKMNLYLNLVDDTLRHATDQPSIGLILCQDKKQILAEYALRGMEKPIGVSAYELTRALPEEMASALPTIAAIEAELAGEKVGEEDAS